MSRLLAGRSQTSQEESAGGLALIISVILSGEGWEGGGIWEHDRIRGFFRASLVLSIRSKVWNEALQTIYRPE